MSTNENPGGLDRGSQEIAGSQGSRTFAQVHFDDRGGCHYGLIFGQGLDARSVCFLHASDAERQLVQDLDLRAPEIGLKPVPAVHARWGGSYQWPYGPNLYVADRVALLDWAVPNWLRISDASSRCAICWVSGSRCPSDGRHLSSRGWIDHPTRWNLRGKPRVFVSQPYSLSGQERAEVEGLVAAANSAGRNLRLEISEESGWYGKPTVWVAIWNETNR